MKNKEQNENTVNESKNQTILVVNGPKEFDVFKAAFNKILKIYYLL